MFLAVHFSQLPNWHSGHEQFPGPIAKDECHGRNLFVTQHNVLCQTRHIQPEPQPRTNRSSRQLDHQFSGRNAAAHIARGGGAVQSHRGSRRQPGTYNGVMLARLNTDIALADFEASVRNLVADVETAYWELYFEYRSLDSTYAGSEKRVDYLAADLRTLETRGQGRRGRHRGAGPRELLPIPLQRRTKPTAPYTTSRPSCGT